MAKNRSGSLPWRISPGNPRNTQPKAEQAASEQTQTNAGSDPAKPEQTQEQK